MSRIELALILAFTAVLFFAGWEVRGWRDNASLTAQANAMTAKINEIQKQAQATSAAYETQRAMASQVITNLNKTMEKYRAKDHIAADCFIPADGMLAVASAVKAGSTR